jgi:hypothetical protein
MSVYVAVCASVTIIVLPRIAPAWGETAQYETPATVQFTVTLESPGTASKLAMNSEIAGGDACGRFAEMTRACPRGQCSNLAYLNFFQIAAKSTPRLKLGMR